MDVQTHRHYVAGAMEILLILSALLSALNGALTGPRGPEAAIRHEAAVEAVAVAEAAVDAVAAASLPAASAPAEAPRVSAPEAVPADPPADRPPLATDRLIECVAGRTGLAYRFIPAPAFAGVTM